MQINIVSTYVMEVCCVKQESLLERYANVWMPVFNDKW